MKKRALLPTDHTYSSMFAACGAAGPAAAPIMDKVRAEMERRNIRPNTVVTNAMISGLDLGSRQEVDTQVSRGIAKMKSRPDIFTTGAILLAGGKDKTRGLEVARRVWSEMRANDLKADLYSYNTLLQVLRDAGLEGVVREGSYIKNAYGEPLKRVVPPVGTEVLRGKIRQVSTLDNARGRKVGTRKGKEVVCTASTLQEGKGQVRTAANHGQQGQRVIISTLSGESTAVKSRGLDKIGSTDCSGISPGKAESNSAADTDESLEWATERSDSLSVFCVREKVEFPLSECHSMTLHIGSDTPEGPPVTRWLEKHSIEDFFAALKHNGVKPDIHTFHLLVHLTLDPAHLLVTMKERKVCVDSRFMRAAITQQASQFRNLQGAKVSCECVFIIG